ncbi:sigma-54-dependent transcriptional regulator [Ignatzschineria sp. LJL83]
MSPKTPHILIIDDEKDICNLVSDILQDEGYEVATAYNGAEAKAQKAKREPDLILLDIWMPDIDGISLLESWRQNGELHCPVIMMSGHGTLEHAIEATKLGAADFLEKPLTLAKLLLVVEKTLEDAKEPIETTTSPMIQPSNTPIFEPVGKSLAMNNLRQKLQEIAKVESNILLTHSFGSEVAGIASYLHTNSQRKTAPFLELSCNSLTLNDVKELIENSEKRSQLLQSIEGGTLYISNLEQTDPQAQQLIYDLLQTKSYLHPQTAILTQANIRFLFSAQSALYHLVDSGNFNEALWHLVNGIVINIPALSEHPEDVPELINYYVHHFVDDKHLTYRHFSIAAQNRLRNHHWKGNHLSLKNIIQRLLVLGKNDEVSLEEVNQALENDVKVESSDPLLFSDHLQLHLTLREAREQFERAYLIAQFERSEGNIANLAELVGMERTNLYRKLKSLDIDPKKGS